MCLSPFSSSPLSSPSPPSDSTSTRLRCSFSSGSLPRVETKQRYHRPTRTQTAARLARMLPSGALCKFPYHTKELLIYKPYTLYNNNIMKSISKVDSFSIGIK
ncbi:hypothetical protein ILYODFUR_032330 [Ilyodon furcidens]|uniref:Uncharacterized protein n=1 Tax=Ilyodon furcidens TaxID=33524 RepID=A0ABV0TPP9_9TELE